MGSYFPKGGHSATQTELKRIMNKHKVKHHRNFDKKNGQQRTTSEPLPWNGQKCLQDFPTSFDTYGTWSHRRWLKAWNFRRRVERLYYLCSENEIPDQQCSFCTADLRLFQFRLILSSYVPVYRDRYRLMRTVQIWTVRFHETPIKFAIFKKTYLIISIQFYLK